MNEPPFETVSVPDATLPTDKVPLVAMRIPPSARVRVPALNWAPPILTAVVLLPRTFTMPLVNRTLSFKVPVAAAMLKLLPNVQVYPPRLRTTLAPVVALKKALEAIASAVNVTVYVALLRKFALSRAVGTMFETQLV